MINLDQQHKPMLFWLLGCLVVMAFGSAISERDFLVAFVGNLIAGAVYLACLGAILGSGVAGMSVAQRTKSSLLGWTVGLLGVAAALGFLIVAETIPGFGWRITKLIGAPDSDW